MSKTPLTIAVVGATGALGEGLVEALGHAPFPISTIRLFASESSLGRSVEWRALDVPIEVLEDADFSTVDAIIIAAPPQVAAELFTRTPASKTLLVDLSTHARVERGAQLVDSLIGGPELDGSTTCIACPTAATSAAARVLHPLQAAFGLEAVGLNILMPASSQGRAGLDELRDQTIAVLAFRPPPVKVFPKRLAFDALPARSSETRILAELPVLLKQPDLPLIISAFTVPVFVGLSATLTVRFAAETDIASLRDVLEKAPGLTLSEAELPTSTEAVGGTVRVGGIRVDPTAARTWQLVLAADNLDTCGAANAIGLITRLILTANLSK